MSADAVLDALLHGMGDEVHRSSDDTPFPPREIVSPGAGDEPDVARNDSAETITLVVADAPLVAEDGRAVFGEAAIGGGCAVIGIGGLDGGTDCDEKTLDQRARKAAVHECAHAAGLEHCADPTCVMYPARNIADVDRKAIGFCARCGADLAHATLDAARI